MGGGESPKCGSNREEVVAAPPSLANAPILLLVCFHKALRTELAEVRRLSLSALESGSHDHDLILDLRRRFEFLKLAYKYHCSAEDEVIFLALNVHIKNVACTYSLEHKSIDDLFDSIFHYLDKLVVDDETLSKRFQELVLCISTIQAAICQHMLKEEEQVFPLLVQQFSSKEQSLLIWQFICSIPVVLLEDVLPWMTSFLSQEEQIDVVHCLKQITPDEKLLQEVIISWVGERKASTPNGQGFQYHGRTSILKALLKQNSSKSCSGESLKHLNPIDGLHLWHHAIRKDLKELLKDLYQIGSENSFSNLGSIILQLKFLADVVIFYGNALEEIFYPAINEIAPGFVVPSYERFTHVCHVEGLQLLLHSYAQNEIPLAKFVEKLCRELESFVKGISKHLVYQETEVFPIITKNWNYEIQQWLLYASLHTLPLGLLKCVVTWFSSHLCEEASKSVLHSIKQATPLIDNSFASLLKEWIRIGYSGKTSVDKFQSELNEIFNNRCSFSSIENVHNANKCSSNSSSSSSGFNLHNLLPGKLKILSPSLEFSVEKTGPNSVGNLEPQPIDQFFFFHKALKKDLECLVLVSAKMAENNGLFTDFCRRFRLLQFLYHIHSDAEDEIAFPALEAKGKLQNISHSYAIDHKLEVEYFTKTSIILEKMSEFNDSVHSLNKKKMEQSKMNFSRMCLELHEICKSMQNMLCDHIHREELELWPIFRECFSIEEQDKIVGCMLGRTKAEILQQMIPWLMAYLAPEEQDAMMSLLKKATKNTMFDEWLGEWWEGMKSYNVGKVVDDLNPKLTVDPFEIAANYLSKESFHDRKRENLHEENFEVDISRDFKVDDKAEIIDGHECAECIKLFSDGEKKRCNERDDVKVNQKTGDQEHPTALSQEDLEDAIRKVSRDSSLDPQKKSHIIQNLLMSRWIVTQKKLNAEDNVTSSREEVPGQHPSYRDPLKQCFGCTHYKRNCKLLAACCNQLYTCIRCHDDVADHSIDRKYITKMMCMFCLIVQPIAPTCATVSCNNFPMAKYYCRICKLFDDDREIYHCPYCNLCRVGKGLGIDYFHCMNCNACMSCSISVHTCRERCLEDNCPICHEYIFTSSLPVKALACGHLMHSTCFQDYTCTHYTCPICSKSLGDMQVYFGMLDALLAEEKIPDEYASQTQVILCNDCEKKGASPFHWLYHKCPNCGSYNTRLL